MRVAVIHYWLVTMRGGERVLERVLSLFPEADVFTHVYNPDAVSDIIRRHKVQTTFIDRLPKSRTWYKKYLPLMPMALEGLNLRGYDLVLSFEAGPSKGAIVPPTALHACYCHSPMRYLWDAYAEYRERAGRISQAIMSLTFPFLRVWDQATAARVDGFMANSNFIRQRIRRSYGRDAKVVFPPVPVEVFQPVPEPTGEYLWVSQMTPYKRGDIAVDAFTRLNLPLHVVGKGDMLEDLRKRAGPTIRFSEKLSFSELQKAYANCQALIFTAEEDFGIVPVEVMAAGRPVIALSQGGVLDTVRPGVDGLYFGEQTVEAVIDALEAFETWRPSFRPAATIAHARRFSGLNFDRNYLEALIDFADKGSPLQQELKRRRAALEPQELVPAT